MRVRRAARADDLLADTIGTRRLWAWLFGAPATASIVIVRVRALRFE